ncbi:hypothetical protein J6590_082174 [Homalodisca vitripennis]|nr:hypothetical protein J6590_082174 [Homalodisca vitripennis]
MEELEVVINENNCTVICIAEHWLQSEEVGLLVPENFYWETVFVAASITMVVKQGNDQLLTLLKNLRGHYRSALKEAKRAKNEEIIESSSNKCKAAWTIINRAAGKTSSTNTKPNIQPDEFNSFCKTSVEEISSKMNASPSSAKNLLQNVLGKAPETFRVLFASVTDHFELCLAKCRTSSQSVQHENSYKDPRAKHCYGDSPPSTDSLAL